MAIDYWRLKRNNQDAKLSGDVLAKMDPDHALRDDILKKMDQVATEWTMIGKIGRFSEYTEEKWQKVSSNIKKELGLSYAGPKAENVIVEPDLPKRAGRSMKSESTETTN
jgi:cobyric acid synthase